MSLAGPAQAALVSITGGTATGSLPSGNSVLVPAGSTLYHTENFGSDGGVHNPEISIGSVTQDAGRASFWFYWTHRILVLLDDAFAHSVDRRRIAATA